MTVSLIAAFDEMGGIGNGDVLPWPKCLEDMRHFIALTTGHTVVMGRRTYESIGAPLPNRTNVVVSRSGLSIPGVVMVEDLGQFLAEKQTSDDLIWVIGGAEVYEQALPYASKLCLTIIPGLYLADVYFPDIRWFEWRRDRSDSVPVDGMKHDYLTFEEWTRIVPANSAIYELSAARSPDQLQDMVEKNAAGLCHFCNLAERQEVVIRGQHWDVFKCNYPYEHTALHVLIVPKAHHVSLMTMMPEEYTEYLQIVAMVEKQFDLVGYSQFMRIGQMTLTGASIAHLHGHVITGDLDDPGFSKIKVKLAERPSK